MATGFIERCSVFFLLFNIIDAVPEIRNTNDHLLENVDNRIPKKILDEIVKNIAPVLITVSMKFNMSQDCLESLRELVDGWEKMDEWAYRVIDSWGKPAGGMLLGTVTSLGSYEECVDTTAYDVKGEVMKGMYCLVDFRPALPLKPRFYMANYKIPGLMDLITNGTSLGETAKLAQFFYFISIRFGSCFPSTCTRREVTQISNELISNFATDATVSIPWCETKQKLNLKLEQIIIFVLVGISCTLVIMGSCFDIVYGKKEGDYLETGNLKKIVRCFSLVSNIQKLMNVEKKEKSLPVLHGLRFISFTWILVGHSYLYVNFAMFRHSIRLSEFSNDFLFQAIVNAQPAVETFFVISGLLTAFNVFTNDRTENKCTTILKCILHRLWRLSPLYFMVLALIFVIPLLTSGPIWYITLNPLVENCRKSWWTNLIYMNNFINTDNLCLEHTWYVAVDMQLYLLGLFVVVPLKKKPVTASIIGAILTLTGIAVTMFITYLYKLPPTALGVFPDPEDRLYVSSVLYFKPYLHVGSYVIGMVIGYIFAKNLKIIIKPLIKIICWSASVVLAMLVVYGTYEWNNYHLPSLLVSVLYPPFSKIAWTLVISWLLVTCLTGQAEFLNAVLSWRVWIPLSRLSYAAYLIHPIIQWVYIASSHERTYASHYIWCYLIFGHFLVTMAFSLVLTLLFEIPFINLEKLIFSPRAIGDDGANESKFHSVITD